MGQTLDWLTLIANARVLCSSLQGRLMAGWHALNVLDAGSTPALVTMIHVKQYRPAFCEGWENKRAIVKSLDDALKLPWIPQGSTVEGRFIIQNGWVVAILDQVSSYS